MPTPPVRRTCRRHVARAALVLGASTALLLGLTPAGQAQTPAPTPSVSQQDSTPPTATAQPTSPVTPATADPRPSPATATPSPAPAASATSSPSPAPALTLTVSSSGGPVAGAYYEDLGRFALTGVAAGNADGAIVTIARRLGTGPWTAVTTVEVVGGRYAASLPVEAAGAVSFRATTPGTGGAVLSSPAVAETVRDSAVSLTKPATTVDSLKNLTVTGTVVPARVGVSVRVEVRRGSGWKQVAVVPTDAAGRFTTTVGYDRGGLATYTIRAAYQATNRNRSETSGVQSFRRVAVLDPTVDATSGADVAKTYRKGCPVGPSKLRTVHLNYYGRDKRIHRGVIIVRTDLTQEITRAFGTALTHRYPIAKMDNPNVYGGNDPRQMAANNTSGFNCRKVVGNPYAQSPHSYGIAIDVNTVQNPYRDVHGKWWPANGKSYIDRTPKRWGMLSASSYLTKSLRKDHYFWGGRWNPGRDYQHFEYRG